MGNIKSNEQYTIAIQNFALKPHSHVMLDIKKTKCTLRFVFTDAALKQLSSIKAGSQVSDKVNISKAGCPSATKI